jgi:hypothetical protein
MRNPIKQLIRDTLAYCGWKLIRTEQFSNLLTLQELLPEPAGIDYVPDRKIGHVGFLLDTDRQLLFLTKLRESRFQKLFQSIRLDQNINIEFIGKNYRSQGLIHNGFYPTPDAELYAAFIAEYEPVRIIEIGSGYSTLIAAHAIRHLGIHAEISVIDPEPRRDVEDYASRIERQRVERSSILDFDFSTRGQPIILFIDSSHITTMDRDIPFLFCRLLPNLPPGVIVHVHDIFTPFDYPVNYARRFYTEQYVLQALLAHNPKFRILFSTYLMSRKHAPEMQSVFGSQVGRDPLFFGSSFWMETVA